MNNYSRHVKQTDYHKFTKCYYNISDSLEVIWFSKKY